MASCSTCSTTILFGGTKGNGRRYCNEKCMAQDAVASVSETIPDEVVAQAMKEMLEGDCPVCGERGPVDVFVSHKVTSMLVVTSWKNEPRVSCRGCATKAQIGATLHSTLLGWWGIPWGLVMTPVQIVRNLSGLVRQPDPSSPSPHLEHLVRSGLAVSALEQAPGARAA